MSSTVVWSSIFTIHFATINTASAGTGALDYDDLQYTLLLLILG